MIDAECQQLHNGNYRFEDGINGGINGVFGFSSDWRLIGRMCLGLLSWPKTAWTTVAEIIDLRPWGVWRMYCKRLFGAVCWVFPVWPDDRVDRRYSSFWSCKRSNRGFNQINCLG